MCNTGEYIPILLCRNNTVKHNSYCNWTLRGSDVCFPVHLHAREQHTRGPQDVAGLSVHRCTLRRSRVYILIDLTPRDCMPAHASLTSAGLWATTTAHSCSGVQGQQPLPLAAPRAMGAAEERQHQMHSVRAHRPSHRRRRRRCRCCSRCQCPVVMPVPSPPCGCLIHRKRLLRKDVPRIVVARNLLGGLSWGSHSQESVMETVVSWLSRRLAYVSMGPGRQDQECTQSSSSPFPGERSLTTLAVWCASGRSAANGLMSRKSHARRFCCSLLFEREEHADLQSREGRNKPSLCQQRSFLGQCTPFSIRRRE